MAAAFVFRTTVDGLFNKAYGSKLSPTQRQLLKQVGIDLNALKPTYEEAIFTAGVVSLRDWFYPQLTDKEAYEKIGMTMVDGYFDTTFGRLISFVMQVMSPEKVVARMPTSFAEGGTYPTANVRKMGPRHYEVDLIGKGTLHTGFTAGTVIGGVLKTKTRSLTVSYTNSSPDDVLSVKWE